MVLTCVSTTSGDAKSVENTGQNRKTSHSKNQTVTRDVSKGRYGKDKKDGWPARTKDCQEQAEPWENRKLQ